MNADVIRVSTTKALMPSTLRNGQAGYCTDTYEWCFKTSGGDMKYYTTQEDLIIAATQVTYTNVADGGITNVKEGLDFAIDNNIGGEGTEGYVPRCASAVPLEYADSPIFVDASDNIGIGTTEPISKVHIEGDVYINSDQAYGISAECVGTAVNASGFVGISATGSSYAGTFTGTTLFNGIAKFSDKVNFTQDTISVNASLTTYDMSNGTGKTMLFASPTANGYFLNTDGASVGDILIVVNVSDYTMSFEIISESTGWAVFLTPKEGAMFVCIDELDSWAHICGKRPADA